MEVVNTPDKRCRVEHDLIRNSHYKKNYFNFGNLINIISTYGTSEELRKIIKEGKWYIEESEGGSDE